MPTRCTICGKQVYPTPVDHEELVICCVCDAKSRSTVKDWTEYMRGVLKSQYATMGDLSKSLAYNVLCQRLLDRIDKVVENG